MPAKNTPEREKIPLQYRWDTKHLHKSDEAWERDRARLLKSFPAIVAYKGKLKVSNQKVLSCLEKTFDALKQLSRLMSYAARKHDEDTRVAKYQGMKEIIEKVATELSEIASFVDPELLALPAERIRSMILDQRFKDFDQYLKELLRQRAHVLSKEEEALLASASLMQDAGHNVYSVFSGADLKFPFIENEKGTKIQLTQAHFPHFRASSNRKVRKKAFEAFLSTYDQYKNTLSALLSAQLNANVVFARARKYTSALEAALDEDNIPVLVYTNMIKSVHKHLPLLHRYLEMRRSALRLKKLHYHDLYAPIVKKVRLPFPYDKGCQVLIEAMKPLGEEYVNKLGVGLAFNSGWIDVFPNKGKQSGAYMDGSVYDEHPFILGNYLNDYDSLSMLAHEMGHAMHSCFSNEHQPYPKADYSIFLAEVASTLNEALLVEHLFKKTKAPGTRRFLLVEQLENFRQTFFRQALFAEFELEIYKRAEKNQPLTADILSEIYLGLTRFYYGHDKNVVHVEDRYGMEWAYIPHFYYNFYVFQYVTGITAATALAEMIIQDGKVARERYISNLLEAGCSNAPLVLLRNAGVDLTSVRPYVVAMSVFERILDRLEA
ncbi:MAG: oligoendopeptidase F [Pseudomonadota bacterium]